MRKKRLMWNISTSILYQVVTIICGMILPRLILDFFGSDVNGLVNSIKQFLTVISFLELGVGAVVQSVLYKPLAENDTKKMSQIITSAKRFFNKIAIILLAYIAILLLVYPKIINSKFGYFYTDTLILAISISSLVQYYFGLVDILFLNAAQKAYIQYIPQTISVILNTVICYVLMRLGASIQIIKFVSSLIFLIRPIILRIYIRKYYNINYNESYDSEPIKQKWNGLAQHIASIVLDSTDVIVLSVFSTLANVSIYTVYYLVISGIKQLFTSLTTGFQALIGELWAKREIEELNKTFGWFEWLIHTLTVFLFGCTGMLIVPFVQIYTHGVTDANYIQPLFATLLTVANAVHCIRLPYNNMILAGGHYKQTQSQYIISAILNIVISIFAVKRWGLIGVAIGTLVAMGYQTIMMAIYTSNNLLRWPIVNVIKQFATDAITVIIASILSNSMFHYVSISSYGAWCVLALQVSLTWLVTIILINSLVFKDEMIKLVVKILKK